MIDAHCHIVREGMRCFLCEPADSAARADDVVFFGRHPWAFLEGTPDVPRLVADLEARLVANPCAGVGEIGLDRLKVREIPPGMRAAFDAQLALAAKLHRPVVLHGAKCWGQVVAACRPYAGSVPAFLFHGFSRSGGLLPEIVALGGYVSVGPAVLNDHAVNYRELVREIPLDRLLVESDATAETAGTVPSLAAILAKTAEIRGLAPEDLIARLDANAACFLHVEPSSSTSTRQPPPSTQRP